MTDLILKRILQRIEHPHKDEIPYLACQPLPWPLRFRNVWRWNGAKSGRYPMVWLNGKTQPVYRVLYHLLIEPLTPQHRLSPPLEPLNVNPALCTVQLINRVHPNEFPPPENFGELAPLPQQSAEPSIDLDELTEWIDEIDPYFVSDLKPLFDGDVPPQLIFEALKQANLIERLEITTVEDLYHDTSTPPGNDGATSI